MIMYNYFWRKKKHSLHNQLELTMLFINLYGSNNNICHCSIFITIIDKSKEGFKGGGSI